MKKKFKIVTDTETSQVKVLDLETGNPVGGIQSISWKTDVNNAHPVCVIEMIGVDMEGEVDATVVRAPLSHPHFPSGTIIKYGNDLKDKGHCEDWLAMLNGMGLAQEQIDLLTTAIVPPEKPAKKKKTRKA